MRKQRHIELDRLFLLMIVKTLQNYVKILLLTGTINVHTKKARDSCDAVIALCKTCLDGKWPARQADASSCQYHDSVHFTE